MAKINMAYKFKTLDGKIIQGDDKGKEKFSLKDACVDSLLNPEMTPEGRPVQIKGEDKLKRYLLAQKIHASNGMIEIQSEEIALIKDLIGKSYAPLIVGQAWEALEGK